MRDRVELRVSPDITLVHDPFHREGKTSGMDKGMFLALKGTPCAGESAGLGLPVLKLRGKTYFPSLSSVRSISPTAVEMTFRMDRVLMWYLGEHKAPDWFGWISERIVEGYVKKVSLQHRLLKLREAVFPVLRIRNEMTRGKGVGSCISRYEAGDGEVRVCIDAVWPGGEGMLAVLNESDGRKFSRLRIGEHLFEDAGIPAWRETAFGAVFESPSLGLGVSLSPCEGEGPARYRVFCGREVGAELNWAGLAVVSPSPVFSYRIQFHSPAG